MNYSRIIIGTAVATVVYYIYGFLVEGVLIRKAFSPYSAVYRSAETVMGYLPIGFACTLIGIFVVAMIYAKSYESGSGFSEGLRFGLLVGVFVVCTFVGPNYVTLNIGRKLALELAASVVLQWTIVCVVIGLIYKPGLTIVR